MELRRAEPFHQEQLADETEEESVCEEETEEEESEDEEIDPQQSEEQAASSVGEVQGEADSLGKEEGQDAGEKDEVNEETPTEKASGCLGADCNYRC